MLKQPNLTDDLFEKSSMSFGEHLDELRKALVKAFLWLAVGTCIGLFFANSVVNFISLPLRQELNNFYLKQTARKFKAINNVDPAPELVAWMSSNSVMPERIFVLPSQLASSEGPQTDQDLVWKDLTKDSMGELKPLLIMRPIPNRLSTFDALEGFLIWLKAALLVGATIASPGIFWHIWEFLAAGLYPHERKYVYLYLPLSVMLFISGVCLAFFVIFELVINFLLTYNEGMDIDFAPRLKDYVSFALFLPLGFGVAFQLPIVMVGLNRFGIISTELYISKWRIAVLAIAFLSMVLTPADAYSMVGMFIPLTFLYFLGIALCKFMPKGPGLGSQAFDPAG